MSQPYVGEIRMFAGNFAPAGWMFCQGQLLPISEYETLFNLIGTTYGGDGQSTFALPDLRGRLPIHHGVGVCAGSERRCRNRHPDDESNAGPHPHGLRHDEPEYRFPPKWQFPGRGARYLRSEQARDQHHGRRDWTCGWKPAARQFPAIPVCEFHSLPLRNIPDSDLARRQGEPTHVHALSYPRSKLLSFGFAPKGLGALQRAAPAHQSEPGTLLAARNHLRWRRTGEFRLAESARPHPDAHGKRTYSRRAWAVSRITRSDHRAPRAHPYLGRH